MANQNVGHALKAAVVAILGAVLVGSITLGATALFEVDTQSEWSSNEASQSNTVYTDGYLQFDADGDTSASYTSQQYTYNQSGDVLDRVQVQADDINSNNSVDVTVTGYDDTDTQTDTITVTLENGENTVDVSGFADTTSYVEVSYSLSRDAGTDTSPTVNNYAGETVTDESLVNLQPVLQLIVIAVGILVIIRSI